MKVIKPRLSLLGLCFFVLSLGMLSAETACRGRESTQDAASASSSSEKLSLKDQEKLAKKLYAQMIKTDEWETDVFLKLHTQVVEQCPDTSYAPESLWRLSNLFLFGMGEEADQAKIIEVLEKLVDRYPDSSYATDARDRLLVSYEEIKNYAKALKIYEEKIAASPGLLEDPESTALMLGYAKALAATGDRDEAKGIYEKIIGWRDQIEPWLADIAQDELDTLNGIVKQPISQQEAVRIIMDLPEVKALAAEYRQKGWLLVPQVIIAPTLEDGQWMPSRSYTIGVGREEGGDFIKGMEFLVDCLDKDILVSDDFGVVPLEEWRKR